MKFQLPRNSLFAILLRSRWWVSALSALGVFVVARLLLGPGIAAFAALPFVVIALYAGFQQLTRPPALRLAAALERARNLSVDSFAEALGDAFRREGYAVKRSGGGADFELEKDGKTTLVAWRRWKAARTGVAPLREFREGTRAREAHERIYVAAGELSERARAYAREEGIRLIEAEELGRLLAAGIGAA